MKLWLALEGKKLKDGEIVARCSQDSSNVDGAGLKESWDLQRYRSQ